MVRNQQGQFILTCPNCRQVTPVPANGVAGLQAAFQISHLLDILSEHKKTKEDALYCADHQERELELYCESCEQFICLQCTITEHNDHNYNLVKDVFNPSPSMCRATGKGLEVAIVGETSSAILQVLNFKGQPCEGPMLSSECELVSDITGSRARGSVERRGQSQYEINYQPTIKGRHQLHVKVEGQHIRGSPFDVTVKLPVEKLGAPMLSIGAVRGPWCVAINQRGELVVTEYFGHRVSVFSPSGEKLRSFGSEGFDAELFQCPTGVVTITFSWWIASIIASRSSHLMASSSQQWAHVVKIHCSLISPRVSQSMVIVQKCM